MAVKRIDRINEEVKKGLADIIRELKDPRVSVMTTVVDVDMTTDFKQARVSISVYDQSEESRTGTVDALNHASGFIARELGRKIDIRRTPQLTFVLDNNIEYSVRISGILDKLNRESSSAGNAGKEDGDDI